MKSLLPAGLFAAALLIWLGNPSTSVAGVVEYDLTIAETVVNLTGRPVKGMTINGGIPGPTLRFKVGDTARIRVRNEMDVPTSIHWHGVLVPPGMDGVPNVSFPPIEPKTTFTYEFAIRHSGTYWYHSHSGLQEQRGVYGSLVFTPEVETTPFDRDYVVLLSDWTDEDPYSVLRTLKRGSEWYALEKGSAQSIIGAARAGKLGDYLGRELSRMPAMDIADVAYDRFLANGEAEISLQADGNDKIRLRIIDGSATTYFHLQFAGGPMTIIAADGQDVKPLEQNVFLVGVAETYDVKVAVPEKGSWELRATAHDGSGFASVWLGEGEPHPVQDLPRPDLYHSMMEPSLARVFALTPAGSMGMPDRDVEKGRFDNPGMYMEMSMTMSMGEEEPESMGAMGGMEEPGESSDAMTRGPAFAQRSTGDGHGDKEMVGMAGAPTVTGTMTPEGRMFGKNFRFMAADVSSSSYVAVDGVEKARPGTPYAGLRAVRTTALDPEKPVREIRLTLDGDMERYVWFLNKKPLFESDSILIHEGEVVRFIMINRTMMHHPMHLHGHFFRVLNGQGDRSPFKHTVDVAPMSTTVIEFAANEAGDWFFHCHLLYHMKSGMARVVHYDGFDPGLEVNAVRSRLYRDPWYFWGHADGLSNMTEGAVVAANTRNTVMLQWEAGWEEVPHMTREATLTWDLYINRFTSVFAGVNRENAADEDDTLAVLGLRYLLPLNIESFAWVDEAGDNRYGIEKDFALTPRVELFGELEFDTEDKWEGNGGLTLLLSRSVSLLIQRHSEFEWGAGLRVRF